MIAPAVVDRLRAIAGAEFVRVDGESLTAYGTDALKRGHPADAVVLPANTAEIAAIAALCNDTRTPLVPRGGGTGYTGGAVPTHGGVVLSLERLNRILEIDELNLLAVVEPNVITGDIQDAVEKVGLFYPPDPASLRQSVIGGNVAECAGGPRAFNNGVTKAYVLGLEAVLPSGEIIKTGGKVVKNVVGYDLTQLLVGSEGTLAIITKIILRLVPKPPVQVTMRASFPSVRHAVNAVTNLIRARVVPAALELIDGDSLEAVAQALKVRSLAPEGTAALLLIEVDGIAEQTAAEAVSVEGACMAAGATEFLRAKNDAERQELWRVRREISTSLKMITPLKVNHDIVVPKGRVPELFELVDRIRAEFRLRIPCFGHVGDGNIHVNIMVMPGDEDEIRRAHEAEGVLFRGAVALEGSISGEHGIGFAKAPYLPLELTAPTIEMMKRVKAAFDPNGILNPGENLSMMMAFAALFAMFLQTPPPAVVVFETAMGTFEVAIDTAHAPVTAANFLKYVDDGAYDNGFFHRTVRPGTETNIETPIQVVQASRASGVKAYPPIPLERTNATGLKHLAGTISMARSTAPDSASSDFFVCVTDTPSLDFAGARNPDGQGFAAFGRVISGLEVINKIQASPTRLDSAGHASQTLDPRIAILKVYRKK